MIDKEEIMRSMLSNFQSSLILNVACPGEQPSKMHISGFGKQEERDLKDQPNVFAVVRSNAFGVHPPLMCLEEPAGDIVVTDGGATDAIFRSIRKKNNEELYGAVMKKIGIEGFGLKDEPYPLVAFVRHGDIFSAIQKIVSTINKVDAGVDAVKCALKLKHKKKKSVKSKNAVKEVSGETTETVPGESE